MGYRRKTSNAEKKNRLLRIVNIIIRNGITISRELYLKP